jgi:hypothetical protein
MEAENVQYNTRFYPTNVCFETKLINLICLSVCYIPTTRSFLETWLHFKNLVGSVLLIVLVFCVAVVVFFFVFSFLSSSCVLCAQCFRFPCPFLPLRFSLTVFSNVYLPFLRYLDFPLQYFNANVGLFLYLSLTVLINSF